MYLRGKTQQDIATHFGCARSQVAYDLKVIRRHWRVSAIRDFDAAKSQELAKIDTLETEYWDAWERSKAESKRQTVKERFGAREVTATKEAQCGDPRYLQGVQWCITKRSEILGLNAAEKIDLKVNDIDDAINRELAKLAARSEGASAPASTVH